MVDTKYGLDIAIRDAAKVAYVAALVIADEPEFRSFEKVTLDEIKRMTITTLNTKLNKLKKSNVKAFYYWAMVDKLLSTPSV